MNGWKLLVVIRISRRILMFHLLILDDYVFIITLKGLLAICVRACFCWLLFGVLKIVESSVRRRKKWIDDILVRYLYIHPRIPQYSGWLVFFWQPINFLEKEKKVKGGLFVFFLLVVRSVLLWWYWCYFFFNYFLFGWRKNGYFIYI